MEQKYIFLVDNEHIAMNIIASGYLAIALISDNEAYDSAYSFWSIWMKLLFKEHTALLTATFLPVL